MKKYTKKERKQIRYALEKARPFLWYGKGEQGNKEEFLCCAIAEAAHVSNNWGESRVCADLARSVIRDRLAGQGQVDDWLINVAKVPADTITSVKIQTYRHRWLKSLIAEFSV